jgi:hypothetical protein
MPQTPAANNAKEEKKSSENRLIYPLITPRGPNGNETSIKGDLTWKSKAVDYLKFTIYDSDKGNPYNNVGSGGKGGTNFAGNADAIYKTIYLYLPHDLNEQYSTDYNKVALGPFGDFLMDAINNGSTEGLAQKLQTAAEGAKPEVAFSAIAGGFNGLMSAAGVSGNLDKNALVALSKKKIFNPYEETVFKGVRYRSHSFTFDLAPRNQSEATTILKIIQELRQSMLPGVNGENDRWLTIPRFFRCEVVRIKPTEGKISDEMRNPEALSYIMRFPTKMVLVDMQVNLTPSGQNTSLKSSNNDGIDYGPAQYRMTLRFDETAFLTREMFDKK